jgi:plastocyanin
LALAACGSTSETKSSGLDFGFGPAQGVAWVGHGGMAAQSITIEIRPQQSAMGGADEVTMPANFAVQPGTPVKVVIYNYTNGVHTFTAPELGVNTPIPPAASASPSVTTFTFTPKAAGVFEWRCIHCGTHMLGKVYALIGYAPAKKA